MKNQEVIDPALQAELAAIARSVNCELLHVEFKGRTLRLVLDRPEGVTLAHCERVSKQVSGLLDVIDFGRDRYLLEVSSPGLDRPLYRPDDYRRFQGRLVKVTFQEADGPAQTLVGRLEAFLDEGGGQAVVVDEATRRRYSIPLENIKLARLEIEL